VLDNPPARTGPGSAEHPQVEPYDGSSPTGWSPENPLTARVFVNRVWQFHFGEGIVRSVDDFGKQGEKPTHPELLDYLAVEFQERGWDLKWLNKQIMMSQVYRQDSADSATQLAADPSARLFWRKPPLRIEAEAVRFDAQGERPAE
jgi:hypothetical protein